MAALSQAPETPCGNLASYRQMATLGARRPDQTQRVRRNAPIRGHDRPIGAYRRRNGNRIGPVNGAAEGAAALSRFWAVFDDPAGCPALARPVALWQGTAHVAEASGPILAFVACCRSSVVEHSIGNGEVDSSILSGSTIFLNKISIVATAPKSEDGSKCRTMQDNASILSRF